MAFANNILGTAHRASFQTAGGTRIKIRHPYLAGQLASSVSGASVDGSYDEVDISASAKLDDEFFRAEPVMDSSKMVVLVDGGTVTITNDIQAGTIQLHLVPTTGLVGSGDAIACLQLIAACKDSVGGVLTTQKDINGKTITRIYYGLSVQNVPHEIIAGNDVPLYTCKLLYAGWIQTVSAASAAAKAIWAAGNTEGLSAIFKQFGINKADSTSVAAATAGTQLGDSGMDDKSSSEGIENYDAQNLAGITADNDMLGVTYSAGSSVIERTSEA
jgi:hypothetical protein